MKARTDDSRYASVESQHANFEPEPDRAADNPAYREEHLPKEPAETEQ
jgi:hypothetical protein